MNTVTAAELKPGQLARIVQTVDHPGYQWHAGDIVQCGASGSLVLNLMRKRSSWKHRESCAGMTFRLI